MTAIESWVFGYLVNALWQVPMVFAVAWPAARSARRIGLAWEHRVWTVALVLQATLPGCSLRPSAVWQWLLSFAAAPTTHGTGVSVTMGEGQARSAMQLPPVWLHLALLLYAAAVLYFTLRLIVQVVRTLRLRVQAAPLLLAGEAQVSFERMARLFGVQGVATAWSAKVCGPVVLGFRHPMLLLPQTLPNDVRAEDFAAALAHEFAHLQRSDFAKNLACELLALPVAFHPLLWPTRSAVAASREALCDALAADAVQGRQRYAHSLLRLAARLSERTRSNPTHAIGIFDANSFGNFERRVMQLTDKQMEVHGVRRWAVAALSVALGFGTCGTALALRLQTASGVQQASAPQPGGKPNSFILEVPQPANGVPAKVIFVETNSAKTGSGDMGGPIRIVTPVTATPDQTVTAVQLPSSASPEPEKSAARVSGSVMAGNMLTRVNPVYPQAAKDAKVQGAVLLRAMIGKDGAIKELQVLSGPAELTQSALDAVQQWVYKPYLLNGQPTEVETTITVNYSLQS